MRRLLFHLLPVMCSALILTAARVSVAAPDAPPVHKHALLIGISDYHAFNTSGYFPDLNCAADVQHIQAALVTTFKLDPKSDITTLTTPAQTKKQAILDALGTLVTETGPGDLVYIHYSGHGDQIPDPTEPTGLDSTIVPCDYQTPAPDGALQSAKAEAAWNVISGKTLRGYIQQLQAKHPAQIVLSFDSCHSASVTRGAEVKQRGRSYGDYVHWYNAKFGTKYAETTPAPAGAPDTKTRGGRILVRGPAWPDLGSGDYVVISACRSDKEALECHDQDANVDMGRLSYCLARVLMQATPDTTYQQVYSDVSALFHEKFSDQEPQVDGDPNTRLFGGAAVPPPASLAVQVDSPGHYSLAAGRLQGITRGSEFALYPAHAAAFTPANQIGTAQVSAVDLTSATLELTNRAGLGTDPDTALVAAQAVETRHNYSKPPLSLDADSLRHSFPTEAPAMLDKINGLGMVSTTLLPGQKDYDLKLVPSAKNVPTLVRADTGSVLQTLDGPTSDLPTLLYQTLQKEARYRYACGLGVGQRGLNPAYQIRLRLVPVVTEKDDDGLDVIKSAGTPLGPNDRLSIGQSFVVEVQNTSAKPLHLAVLDLESDGNISQVWPNLNDTDHDENVLQPTPPGQWVRLWMGSDTTQPARFVATTPDAGEIYKALATDDYVDYQPLVTRGHNRGGEGPFSDLFGPALDDGTRGSAMVSVDPGRWTAATATFEVQ